MEKRNWRFWTLTVSLIFGTALHWLVWCKLVTILLSGMVLLEVARKIAKAYERR